MGFCSSTILALLCASIIIWLGAAQGAVVINDIKDGQTVVGVPALPIIQQ